MQKLKIRYNEKNHAQILSNTVKKNFAYNFFTRLQSKHANVRLIYINEHIKPKNMYKKKEIHACAILFISNLSNLNKRKTNSLQLIKYF